MSIDIGHALVTIAILSVLSAACIGLAIVVNSATDEDDYTL